MAKKSELERLLARQIEEAGLPEPEREARFHPVRRWRFDFSWRTLKLACEVEGGVWVRGRHTRGSGFVKDCEKYNAAAVMGWTVLRFPTNTIEDGTAIKTLKRAMGKKLCRCEKCQEVIRRRMDGIVGTDLETTKGDENGKDRH